MGIKQTIQEWLWSDLRDTLDEILTIVKDIQRKEVQGIMVLTDIESKVTAQTDVITSAKTLLENLSQMLKDAIAANDPAEVQKIADMIDANTAALASAVAANTPAAPPA